MRNSVAPSIDGATLASTPPGTRIYAVGDIHGRADLLGILLDEIVADIREQPCNRPVVVFLGDYVDRGPDSRGVLSRLAAGSSATDSTLGWEWLALRGNHEDFLLRFLSDFSVAPSWFRNGGMETVRSYLGVEPDAMDAEAIQRKLADSMPAEHLRFLSRLPLFHVEGDYVFVHAGLRPGVPLERQTPTDMMWIRDEFIHSSAPLGKIVVHGHSAVPTPEVRRNRIGIDTGAWHSGRLTALVLEDVERRFLVARASAD